MTLPLGIDFGRRRVRVALSEQDERGRPRLVAVATRDHDGDASHALVASVRELGTRERRCVIGIGAPDAILRLAAFPDMSHGERARAARFEAARFVDYPIADAVVTLVPVDGTQGWAIGIARRSAIAARTHALKRAKLTPLAMDDIAFALQRAHTDAHGTIDIGEDATRLIVFARPIPYIIGIPIGGFALTDAIARSLGIDSRAAEERKRTIGFAGAGETERDTLISEIAEAFATARSAGHTGAGTFVMSGNGSRIPGFADAIERATSMSVRIAEIDPLASDALPPDVLRAAGADWSIAYGLSLWASAL